MKKFKSKIDGFVFEVVENSIHYQILVNAEEFEMVEDKPKKKTKKVEE